MYQILYYNDLNYVGLETKFAKIINFLQNGDFKSAEVKKLKPTDYFRARLDITNRLLFKFVKHQNGQYILVLEIIKNHDYDKSRFLRNKKIIEENIEHNFLTKDNVETLNVVPKNQSVHLLNKFIIFDSEQEDTLNCNLPLIVIGSAGSGKTSVSLEKLKTIYGKILYISLSSYLVSSSQKSYYSFNYRSDDQDIDFLSFKEFLETIEIPQAQQINDVIFLKWFLKQTASKNINMKDGRQIFEEFAGVIIGSSIDKAYLSKEEYLSLGIKQSIFSGEEREIVYDLFQKYNEFLKQENYYDSNIIVYKYKSLVTPVYDAILVDEIQDFTNNQLSLILKSLKDPDKFLLCGDSNQIVHPNFFSWSKLKSFFYNGGENENITRILNANYRNSIEVTELANRILRFKNYRFGSIDKESHYLIKNTSETHGNVSCLEYTKNTIKEINAKTSKSTSCAILVLHEHQKEKAKEVFNSPLIFSIQEAKGLEYENIILYNFISFEQNYNDISKDVDKSFLDSDFKYSRTKEKSDKSLEIYKFYLNALYVAITRSICNVYIVETNPSHKFLRLLDINQIKEVNIEAQESSKEEWQKEASKLMTQGKEEQARAIEEQLLKHTTIPWKPIDKDAFIRLKTSVIDEKTASKKDAIKLLNYAIIYSDYLLIDNLRSIKVKAANNIEKGIPIMLNEYFSNYIYRKPERMLEKIDQYGLEFRNEFNLTPLMSAVYVGKTHHVQKLISLGASLKEIDNNGRNAFMISISKAINDQKYCVSIFGEMYEYLKSDSVLLKINNKLVKIESHKSEYFFLLFFLVMVRTITNAEIIHRDIHQVNKPYLCLKAFDLYCLTENFSENVLPNYRKNKKYINALLARNEVNSNYSYNKRLFMRVKKGIYSLNPELQIKLCDDWENLQPTP